MSEAHQHIVETTIRNELGMHARAATKFVQLATNSPACQVFIAKDGQEVNGKSIMGVLMLVAAKGSRIRIRVVGDHAEVVANSLVALIEDRFGEER